MCAVNKAADFPLVWRLVGPSPLSVTQDINYAVSSDLRHISPHQLDTLHQHQPTAVVYIAPGHPRLQLSSPLTGCQPRVLSLEGLRQSPVSLCLSVCGSVETPRLSSAQCVLPTRSSKVFLLIKSKLISSPATALNSPFLASFTSIQDDGS